MAMGASSIRSPSAHSGAARSVRPGVSEARALCGLAEVRREQKELRVTGAAVTPMPQCTSQAPSQSLSGCEPTSIDG
jgi:hypothetical protein